jgi:hypothetical protein
MIFYQRTRKINTLIHAFFKLNFPQLTLLQSLRSIIKYDTEKKPLFNFFFLFMNIFFYLYRLFQNRHYLIVEIHLGSSISIRRFWRKITFSPFRVNKVLLDTIQKTQTTSSTCDFDTVLSDFDTVNAM